MRPVSVAIVLVLLSQVAQAQHDVRSAALRVTRLAVEDAAIGRGTVVRITLQEEAESIGFREGIVEGMLESGLRVMREDTAGEAEVEISFVSRGPLSGDLKVSVVAIDHREGRYILSKAYAVPVVERSLFETVVAPVVVISAAVLVVYLLLTVRSS